MGMKGPIRAVGPDSPRHHDGAISLRRGPPCVHVARPRHREHSTGTVADHTGAGAFPDRGDPEVVSRREHGFCPDPAAFWAKCWRACMSAGTRGTSGSTGVGRDAGLDDRYASPLPTTPSKIQLHLPAQGFCAKMAEPLLNVYTPRAWSFLYIL